ncbi:hypothetical protein [Phaeacidiphilus oryzae]|uniref:hypothetical protein n=1 Tax=Phaeacidiphilus oryzae TaxID=348818 RepID=UPI00068F91E5|nr:hypothetical protein [Phaeacidiphilus oryzae]
MDGQTPLLGDYFVVSGAGTIGRLISVGEWLNGDGFGPWDHAGVYVGNGQVVEAEPHGARLAPADEYADRAIVWSTGGFDLTEAQRAAIADAARGFLGVPYSFLDYLAIAAHRFHLPGGPFLRHYVATTKHMICSQLVDASYEKAGVHLFDDHRWPGYVTPADLHRLAVAPPDRPRSTAGTDAV